MTGAGRHIVRVEEITEALVEEAITGKARDQQELLEEPGRMRPVPFGRTGIGHRLHHLVFRAQGRGAAFGFRAHGTEGLTPEGPRIARRLVSNGRGVTIAADAAKDG